MSRCGPGPSRRNAFQAYLIRSPSARPQTSVSTGGADRVPPLDATRCVQVWKGATSSSPTDLRRLKTPPTAPALRRVRATPNCDGRTKVLVGAHPPERPGTAHPSGSAARAAASARAMHLDKARPEFGVFRRTCASYPQTCLRDMFTQILSRNPGVWPGWGRRSFHERGAHRTLATPQKK